ncbi:SgcJ/EcaC family oxidoreductase [Actinophytocola sp.]|uniref:SgcJ/EcaC family oxidoreductase n=1 Tax=Actinophytocola sp. TaxID=1872138 RepID=UPI002ED39D1E
MGTRQGVRRALAGVLVAMAGLITSTAAVAATPEPASDQAAFDRLRGQQEDAWQRGDAAAWAATFTRDGDMVTFNGDHLSGRQHITTRMQHYFDTYLSGTRLLMLTEQVRYTEPDTAIIVRTGCVLWNQETTCTDEALSVNTNVLIKRHGQWAQTSFQNTRIRPIP